MFSFLVALILLNIYAHCSIEIDRNIRVNIRDVIEIVNFG